MDIEIILDSKEVKDLVSSYALKAFPINTETHDVAVWEHYGGYKIKITENVTADEPETEEAA